MCLSPPALDSTKYFHLKLVSFIDKNLFFSCTFSSNVELLSVATQTEKNLYRYVTKICKSNWSILYRLIQSCNLVF